VNFQPGENFADIKLEVIDNDEAQPDRDFKVVLSDPTTNDPGMDNRYNF
jgi:hypothetical protein